MELQKGLRTRTRMCGNAGGQGRKKSEGGEDRGGHVLEG